MSKTPHIKNIFSAEEEDCLSLEQMVAYRDGKLLAEEKHYAERHLLNCELCEMGYEGLLEENAAVVEAGAAAIADAAWSRVATQQKKRRRGAWVWISAAASVVLLIAVGLVVFKGPSDETMEKVAQQYYKQPTAPPVAGADQGDAEQPKLADIDSAVSEQLADANSRENNTKESPQDLFAQLKENRPKNESMDEMAELEDMEEASPSPVAGSGKIARNRDERTKTLEKSPTADRNQAAKDGVLNPSADAPSKNRNLKDVTSTVTGSDFASGDIRRPASTGFETKSESSDVSDDFDDMGGEVAEEQEELVEMDAVDIVAQSSAPKAEQTLSTITLSDNKALDNRQASKDARKGKSKKSDGLTLSRSKDSDNSPVVRSQDKTVELEGAVAAEERKEAPLRQDLGNINDAKSDPAFGGKPGDKGKDAYSLGMESYRQGRFSESATFLREASAATPSNLQAHFYAAASFLNIDQPLAAQYHLDRILAIPGNSLYADAEWYMAITYLKLKDRAKAKSLLQKISRSNGKYSGQATEALKDL
jgi:tetratricopeptide (TPR) repeat protein